MTENMERKLTDYLVDERNHEGKRKCKFTYMQFTYCYHHDTFLKLRINLFFYMTRDNMAGTIFNTVAS